MRLHAAFYPYGVAVKPLNSGRSDPMKAASEPKWTEFVSPPWLGALPLQCPPRERRATSKFYSLLFVSIMGTTKQALGYTLRNAEMKIGKLAGKTVTIATARARGRVSFMRFCDMVAGHTTFNYMEVASILNLAADTARALVAGGESVEFGRLGSLSPTLRSKAVAQGEEFNAMTHISRARVRLRPNPKFFRLDNVAFERIALEKKAKGEEG